MTPWQADPDAERVVYVWQNSRVKLGVGTTTINGRVRPNMTHQDLVSKKDAGKTIIASYLSRLHNERVTLAWTPGTSDKVSGNTTRLEQQLKRELTGDKFMLLDNTTYSKVEFMDSIFVPHVNRTFGANSLESVIATNCAGDGDLWGRFQRHPVSKQALDNIIRELLWADQ